MRIPDGSFAVAFEQTAALRNRLPQHFDQILRRVLILAALASLASGALLWLFDQSRIASWIWVAARSRLPPVCSFQWFAMCSPVAWASTPSPSFR